MAYGSIIEMGNGRYRVCFDYGFDEKGKRIRRYHTYSSKTEANKAFNKHKVQMDENNYAIPQNISFSEWVDYWYINIAKNQIEKTTAYGYNNILEKYIKPRLGNYKLQKLSPENIQRYYTNLISEGKLSPNTVIKHHNLLTNVLNAARKYEYIVRNPMDAVTPPKKHHQEAKFYSPEQLGRLLMLVQGTRLDLAVNLCAYLGIRRGELCGLKWSDVDFEKHTITIRHTRTQAGKDQIEKDTKTVSSNRTLFMPETLENLLRQECEKQKTYRETLYNAYHSNDFVVVMEDGKPYRPNYLSDLFTKFLKDNGLPPIVLHELRHTFASLSNEAGIPSFNIGKALGHSSPMITQKIYTHILDNTHTTAVQGVATIADQMLEQAKSKRKATLSERLSEAVTQWDPMGVKDYSSEITKINIELSEAITAEALGLKIFEAFREAFGSRNFKKSLEDCVSLSVGILSK